ncbi:hypothetical protein OBBRIDRAFT_890634 [Obba rivulosa]|uniref:Dynein 1 light intermediate chain n=1 Tax=Obba rivulosa TaxID=1052685 RepID=A0A8E2AMX7_9APHY|nr:hypothetical protein OBBRIDRAFT_890634 [Obba rivulosa]
MDNSRPSSPDTPPQDLWSSILDSVSSSRSIPSKQVLVLGQSSSGKSTIVSALLQKPLEDNVKEDQRSDFALGYDWADIRDDADEDTLARLSVYTVPSSAPSYTALLPHFLPPRAALPHTLVMIVLDWTRPWTFVEELETWMQWIEKWAKGDGARDLEIAREENRERWQAHLQHYTEPSAEPLPATSTLSNTVLPLGPGTFTHNAAGVPIIVTCTKADLIDEGSAGIGAGSSGMGAMVKGKGGEWEERTDGVMQVLRTICLKYGAALFYTTPLPQTLQNLRQYTLHLLFTPPAPSLAFTASTDAPAPVRNPFSFQQKPNPLDRDKIVIPAGWDSWGKITVLREGFDPKSWGEAWERDIEYAEGETGEPGAKKLYSMLVLDNSVKPPPLPPFNNPIPEQQFLAKNFDENSKKADRDPRGAFRNPNESVAAGVVGPMGSSSFNLPNVERALTEMEGTPATVGAVPLGSSVSGDAARRLQGRTAARAPPANLAVPPAGIPGRSGVPSPTLSSASPSPGGEKTENHEMLHNFFQDLLRRSKNTASATGTNGAANGAEKDAGSS